MDFRRYVRALRRHLLLLMGCVVLVLGAAIAITQVMTPVYESKARVLVSSAQAETTDSYAGGLLAEQRAATYVEVVESGLVANRVVGTLDGRAGDLDPDEVRTQVSGSVVEDSAVLEITVSDTDAEVAQQLAQTYANELVLTATEIETPVSGDDPPTKITVLDQADLRTSPVSPNLMLFIPGGLLLGLFLGLGLVALREVLDTTITTQEDLALVTEAPLLAAVGHESSLTRQRLVTDLEHHAARVEAFRVLRTNVQFLDVDSETKVFVITSPLKEEGKTSTAVNLALTLARAGGRTLLVDGDLRRPRIAEVFDIDGSAGVTTVLLGKVDLADAIWRHEASDLDVLPSGVVPPNAAELLQTQTMGTLLAELRGLYDAIVVDAPPLLPVTDAALLATRADATVMVVRHGKTTRDQLAVAVERLAQVDVEIAGVVLNRVPSSRTQGRYAYYGGYDTYGPQKSRSRRGSRRRPPASS